MFLLTHDWSFQGIIPDSVVFVLALCQSGACTFWTGEWLARCAPGREIAACIIFTLMQPLLSSLAVLIIIRIWDNGHEYVAAASPTHHSSLPVPPLVTGILSIAIPLAGSLSMRQRTRRTTAI